MNRNRNSSEKRSTLLRERLTWVSIVKIIIKKKITINANREREISEFFTASYTVVRITFLKINSGNDSGTGARCLRSGVYHNNNNITFSCRRLALI